MPVTAKVVPVWSKRKVGRPRKAALALLRQRQFTALLDQSFSDLDDEIDIESESIDRLVTHYADESSNELFRPVTDDDLERFANLSNSNKSSTSLENHTVLQDIVPVLILSSASLPLLVSILKKPGRPTCWTKGT